MTKQAFLEISDVGGGGNRAMIDAKAELLRADEQWRAFDDLGNELRDDSGNRALLRVLAKRLGVPMPGDAGDYKQASDTSHGCNHETLTIDLADDRGAIRCRQCSKRWCP